VPYQVSLDPFLAYVVVQSKWCSCYSSSPYQTVQQGQVGLITRFGKYYKSVDPGLYQVNTWTEQLLRVDIRIQLADIPQQVIMTKDNVSVLLDSVLYWHVVDPYTAQFMVENVRKALIERTQTTLRLVTGTRTLQECIEHRDTLAQEIESIIAVPAASWGVKVESLLIKDLQFSSELLESLSAAAKQKRIGESKVIAAQAEVDAAKLMREASDILNTPAAMQIRYLETLSQMSKNSGTKVMVLVIYYSRSSLCLLKHLH
jgi:erythrocyte band 7 integral membrane protein